MCGIPARPSTFLVLPPLSVCVAHIFFSVTNNIHKQLVKMKHSFATSILSLGYVAVANADFNGIRRIPRSNSARNLNLFDGDASSETLPELVNIGFGRIPADAFPLGKCQGDCDDDGDCEVRLK